jgi:hypothetical protein
MDEWEQVTCAKCGESGDCTPWSDYYTTPLWDGDGRVCEKCFGLLVRIEFARLAESRKADTRATAKARGIRRKSRKQGAS